MGLVARLGLVLCQALGLGLGLALALGTETPTPTQQRHPEAQAAGPDCCRHSLCLVAVARSCIQPTCSRAMTSMSVITSTLHFGEQRHEHAHVFLEPRYRQATTYPSAGISTRYALLNVFGFRRRNWRFDLIGGVTYSMFMLSMMSMCP